MNINAFTPSKKRWISLKSNPNIVVKLTLHLLGVTAIGGYCLGYKQCCVHRTRIGVQEIPWMGFPLYGQIVALPKKGGMGYTHILNHRKKIECRGWGVKSIWEDNGWEEFGWGSELVEAQFSFGPLKLWRNMTFFRLSCPPKIPKFPIISHHQPGCNSSAPQAPRVGGGHPGPGNRAVFCGLQFSGRKLLISTCVLQSRGA